MNYQSEKTDILIVGGGLAGLWAAIRARECGAQVIIADKGKIGRSGVSVFCCGTLAPVPEEDFYTCLKDSVEKGAFMVDQSLLEIVLRENGDRITQMINWGVDFHKDKSGKIHEEDGKGHKLIRSILYSGRQMMAIMRREAEKKGVEFRERLMVVELLTSDGTYPARGKIAGAVGIDTRTGEYRVFQAKAVIITSGLMSTKNHALYSDGLCGDGQAMAFRAGAELIGLEFAPGSAFSLWNRRFVTGGQKQMLANNTRVVNRPGERFMERYMASARLQNPDFDGHVEFGDICRAMAIEIMEGRGPVYLDHSSWNEEYVVKLRRILPVAMQAFDSSNIDIIKELIESTPFTPSYFSSCQAGIRINKMAESTIPGLYAAGAAAFVGQAVTPQGCCNVFGYRAGEKAANYCKDDDFLPLPLKQVEVLASDIFNPLRKNTGVKAAELFSQLNALVTPYKVSLFKEESRIKEVLQKLEELDKNKFASAAASDIHELIKIQEFRNVITLLKLIYMASLERKESRFAHYREEYPYTDNENWLKWVIVKNERNKGPVIKAEPIPFERFRIKAPPAIKKLSYTKYTFA